MRFPPVFFLAVSVAALTGSNAQAQTVRADVDTDTLSIGARHALTVSIRHVGERTAVFPDDALVEVPPGLIGVAGDVELLHRISSGTRFLGDDSQIDSVHYEMTTFAVDTAFVTARVGLVSPADTLFYQAGLEEIPVRSVVPPDAEDIQDLAPLVEFPRAIWPWILALAGIGFALWWFVFRKKEEVIGELREPEEPAEPAYDQAMRRLRSLSTAELADPTLKPYFVELSDIVRTYVARKTEVPALELTTSELVDELNKRPAVNKERIDEVSHVLAAADLVKFADHHPPTGHAREALVAARLSIEHTESDFIPEQPESSLSAPAGRADLNDGGPELDGRADPSGRAGAPSGDGADRSGTAARSPEIGLPPASSNGGSSDGSPWSPGSNA